LFSCAITDVPKKGTARVRKYFNLFFNLAIL
jgi:hypothetical protein